MEIAYDTWRGRIDACLRVVTDEQLQEAARRIRGASLVLTAGNGGSASLASHASQAINKPSYLPGGGVPALCLTDAVPTVTAHANDGRWADVLLESARAFVERHPSCLLLLISSSGKSENICRLARFAREKGKHVLGLTGFQGEPLRTLATLAIHVPSEDYEVVEPVHDALIHRIQYHLRRT